MPDAQKAIDRKYARLKGTRVGAILDVYYGARWWYVAAEFGDVKEFGKAMNNLRLAVIASSRIEDRERRKRARKAKA